MKRTFLVTCLVLVVGVALVCAILSLIDDALYVGNLEDLTEEEKAIERQYATVPSDVVGWSQARAEALISDFEGVQNSVSLFRWEQVEKARNTLAFARVYREYAPNDKWRRELDLFISGVRAFLTKYGEAAAYGSLKTGQLMQSLLVKATLALELSLTNPNRVANAFHIRQELAKIVDLIGRSVVYYEEEIEEITKRVNEIVTDDENWVWIQERLDQHMKDLDEVESNFGTNRLDKWAANAILEYWRDASPKLTSIQFSTFEPQINRVIGRAQELFERFEAWIEKIGGALPMIIAASVGSNYITRTDHCVARARLA